VISYRESLPRLACLIIRPKSDFWTIVVRSVRPYVGDYIDLRFFFLRRSQVIEKCCNIAKTDRSKIEPKVILGLPSKHHGGFGAVAKSFRYTQCTYSPPIPLPISLFFRVANHDRHESKMIQPVTKQHATSDEAT